MDMKYAKYGLGVITCETAETHVDYVNDIKFREIIHMQTGYVLAKVAARDVNQIVQHIIEMKWRFIEVRQRTISEFTYTKWREKTYEAGYFKSDVMDAELYSYKKGF